MTAAPSTPGSATAGAVRAFGWAVVSFGGRKLITFAGTLVLARILVPEHFGLVAAGMALLTYLEMALDLGVGSTVIYEQEEGLTDRVYTAFTLNLALGLLLAAVGVLMAPVIASFFQAADQTNLFRVLFLYLVLKAAGQVPDAVLRRDLDFRRRLVAEIARAGLKVAIAIPLARAGAGAWSIVLGMLVGELAGTTITWIATRFLPRLQLDRDAMRVIVGYGTTMLGVRLVSELLNNGDYLVVGNRLGPEQLGIYSIAYRVPEMILATVFWLYSMVAYPVYAKASARDPEKLKPAMLRAMRLTTLFGLPAGTGMVLVADDAILVLFSDRWVEATVPMTLIAASFAIRSVTVASGDVLPSIGRPGRLLFVNLVVLVPTLGTMVLVSPWGLTAVASVQLLATLLYVPLLQHRVNMAVGTSAREVASACIPALCAAVGVALFAAPLQFLLPQGVLRLVSTIVVGVVGGAVGLLAGGRAALPEIRGVVSRARRS